MSQTSTPATNRQLVNIMLPLQEELVRCRELAAAWPGPAVAAEITRLEDQLRQLATEGTP